MQRRTLASALVLLMFTVAGPATAQSLPNPLLSSLTSSLGVTQDQAEGGLGSILTLAQEKLAKGDFDKVASVIPGASKYLEKAKALGAVAGPLANAAGLNGAFSKLGISPATASKFIPKVTKYVGKLGGKDLGTKLANALL
jgi:uncharacterized protein VcgC/VcgE DUF2780